MHKTLAALFLCLSVAGLVTLPSTTSVIAEDARAFSSGTEDNGLHVGIDGTWPESGRRMQWCEGKNSWRWESKQRTAEEHCGEAYRIFLDVPNPGIHEIQFSMREDGFELDRWLMTRNRDFVRPDGIGPEVHVHSGKVPAPFPFVAAIEALAEPPKLTANAVVEGTDRLQITASQFAIQGSGYYLDKGKWLAFDPQKNKEGRVQSAFAYPNGRYDVTLAAVGESDGKATYQLAANDVQVGAFTCPLSLQIFEEGDPFTVTWLNIDLNSGDVLTLTSQIASEAGKEFSRARSLSRLRQHHRWQARQGATQNLATSLRRLEHWRSHLERGQGQRTHRCVELSIEEGGQCVLVFDLQRKR